MIYWYDNPKMGGLVGVKSEERKAKILNAARGAFLEAGYGRTSYADIEKASGIARGVITHFFANKAALAAVIYEELAAPLVAKCEAALSVHGRDIEAQITGVQSIYMRWLREAPASARLLRELDRAIGDTPKKPVELLRHRLIRAFKEWAALHIKGKAVAELSGDQLYAIILGPLIAVHSPVLLTERAQWQEWLEPLAKMAMLGLTPREQAKGKRFTRAAEPAPSLLDALSDKSRSL